VGVAGSKSNQKKLKLFHGGGGGGPQKFSGCLAGFPAGAVSIRFCEIQSYVVKKSTICVTDGFASRIVRKRYYVEVGKCRARGINSQGTRVIEWRPAQGSVAWGATVVILGGARGSVGGWVLWVSPSTDTSGWCF